MIFILVALMLVMFAVCISEHMRARSWRIYAEHVMRQEQETLVREQRGLEVVRIFTRDTEKLFRELRAECEKVQAERDAAIAELQRVTHGKA